MDSSFLNWHQISAGQKAGAALGLVFTVVFLFQSDLTHFTWFSLLLFSIYCWFIALGIDDDHFYWFETVQIIVISGVLVMSATECDLLSDSKDAVGPAVYFFGNFVMHYLPFLVALACATFSLTDKERKNKDVSDIWLGFGIFVIYIGLFSPKDVYGCSIADSVTLLVSLVVTMVLTATRWFWDVGGLRAIPFKKLEEIF